jgi:hypothetical protein
LRPDPHAKLLRIATEERRDAEALVREKELAAADRAEFIGNDDPA